MLQILFAFLAGVLTVAAPCILPMLPILLGTSIGQQSKQRPLLIVSGFVASFAATSLILATIVSHLGLSPNTLRYIATTMLTIFAIFMIWPKPFEMLTLYMSGTINKAGQLGKGNGNMSGLILGLVLGVIWTPCAGPILGTILTLIATQGTTLESTFLLIAYAIGSAVPMLIIAYGSQYITTEVRYVAQYATRIQQVFGFLVLALAAAMFFQYDVVFVNKLTSVFPQSSLEKRLVQNSEPIQTSELKNYGSAPEFTGIEKWLNSDPLTIKELKGKVVLIDFWTYSCINCVRTLPYVTKWYDTYKDKGFVVIGVHTPEFAFEKDSNNVSTAIKRFGINYPVAQDNNYNTWSAYNNRYWPAEYLIDQNGTIVYTHFGEGNYEHTENAIRKLLGMNASAKADNSITSGQVGSPEMYFGSSRLEYLTSSQSESETPKNYTFPKDLKLNNFALEGTWKFLNDHIENSSPAKIKLKFSSGKLFMVAASKNKQTIKAIVDGQTKEIEVGSSDLYELFSSDSYKEHTVEIEIPEAGFEAFTFTFG